MASLCLLRTFILALTFIVSPVFGDSQVIVRDEKGFPACLENVDGKNLFLKYSRRSLTRNIRYVFSRNACTTHNRPVFNWKELSDEVKQKLSPDIQWELTQIAQKATEFRDERTASEFIDNRNIRTFTRELNRELTPKYGPIFSAEVFRELEERKPGNREFRKYVLDELRKSSFSDKPFETQKESVKIIVSFGLGWSDDYGIAAPYYIKDFLSDIESMGLEVVYLKKNPFGMIRNNVNRIVPQIEAELSKEKKVIFLSLCKGTPELFSALAQISPELKQKIIGHVNLSGMLSGTFFADITMSVLIPRLLSPFLKIIPVKEIRDAGKMASSTNYMKSSVIAQTLEEVKGKLMDNVPTVNVTGAPMSNRVMNNGSPMGAILKYNSWQKFLVSATDGFIELPHTLVPEDLAPNQVSLVIDSTHMLSDGYLEEFALSDRSTRRRLYQSIVGHILAKQSL